MAGRVIDYWVACEAQFNAAIINGQAADPGNDFFFLVGGPGSDYGTSLIAGFQLGIASETPPAGSGEVQWRVEGPSAADVSSVGGPVAADTLYTVELHVVYDMANLQFNPQLFINGADQGVPTGQSFSVNEAGGDNFVGFGGDVPDGNDGDLVKIQNVKIGSARGLSDIFDGSSLAGTVVPPFSSVVGRDPATALSASGGVLSASTNWTASPLGPDYALVDMSAYNGPGSTQTAGDRYICHRV